MFVMQIDGLRSTLDKHMEMLERQAAVHKNLEKRLEEEIKANVCLRIRVSKLEVQTEETASTTIQHDSSINKVCRSLLFSCHQASMPENQRENNFRWIDAR